MQPHEKIFCVATLGAAMCFGATAIAADTQKSGTDSFMTNYVISGWNPLKMGSTQFATAEFNAVSTSSNAMFNHMGVRCLGGALGSGDAAQWRGACTMLGKDGGQIFLTWDGKGAGGGIVVIGGTGQYQGITGTGEWTTTPVPGPDGHVYSATLNKVQWKIR